MEYLKIIVKTPKNQAEKCKESFTNHIVPLKKRTDIVEVKVTSHNEFYILLSYKVDEDKSTIFRNISIAEVTIKKFYRTLMKNIDRANFLANKFKKGLKWIKYWLVKKARKIYEQNPEYIASIENMTDEEIKNYITIEDREEMEKLLAGDLISVEVVQSS